jgi:hypothetical protein
MQLTTNGEADGPPVLIENFLIKFSKQVKKNYGYLTFDPTWINLVVLHKHVRIIYALNS